MICHHLTLKIKATAQFTIKPLPLEAQVAPVYGMISEDVDGDGNLDLLMVGNDYGMDPYSGRHDAFMGLYMKGDGKGNFSSYDYSAKWFFCKRRCQRAGYDSYGKE